MSNPQETTSAMNPAPTNSVTLNGVTIDDTFAEAFPMKATRVLITAHNETWARNAAVSMTGFATSVIACGCEAGIERMLGADETPDGRPGVSVLLFSMSGKELAKQLERRVGQCVLTCPTTAIYAGLDEGEAIALGRNLRFFGDGWQISKMIDGKRYWRVPASSSLCFASGVSAGQKASLVEAISAGYLLPTFEPERTTPPGKGMMVPRTARIASTAASAPASAASVSRASSSKLPPPTAFTSAVVSCATNSPSITGTRQ